MKHLQQYEKFISIMKGKIDMDDIENDLDSYLSENENFELMGIQVRNHGNNLYSISVSERFSDDKFDKDYILELNNGILPYVAKECGANLQEVRVSSLDKSALIAQISFYLQYPIL